MTFTLDRFHLMGTKVASAGDSQKVESLVRSVCTITSKDIQSTKEGKNHRGKSNTFQILLAIMDSKEQGQIPRPVDKNKRKMSYSGKKKRHTVKNQIMVNKDGCILYKTVNKKGRKHIIYSIYKKNHPVFPKQFVTVVDLGYLGMERDFPEQLSALPFKKKRNLDLSKEEKAYNIIHSKKRVVIEHAIL